MSSTIEVQRICEYCEKTFIAKTTLTRYCSHKCNSRGYKRNVKNLKIQLSNKETQITAAKPFEELASKPFLSVDETCKLIGISRRTIYRLLQKGELIAGKAGQRTIIPRKNIESFFELTQWQPK